MKTKNKIFSLLPAAVLLFSGCTDSLPSAETKKLPAEYSEGYAGIRMELPEGWVCEPVWIAESDDDGYARGGLEFRPEDQPDIRMGLYYYTDPYGICGTGVTREELTFSSGCGANLYWEELDELTYVYVFYKDTPGEYLFEAHYIPTDFWHEERETILSILDSAHVGNGALKESEAFALAEAECTKKYPQSSRHGSFDYLTGQWTFEFYGNPGVVLESVTVNPDGTAAP